MNLTYEQILRSKKNKKKYIYALPCYGDEHADTETLSGGDEEEEKSADACNFFYFADVCVCVHGFSFFLQCRIA